MIFSLLFYGFLLYILYRLVFNFIIPIYKTTRQVKRSFREMQEKMYSQQANTSANGTSYAQNTQKQGSNVTGEYIDFEEVKE